MRIFILIVLFISSILAKDIIVGVGLSLEPYIIHKNNSGIELDIIKNVMKNAGYDIKIKYLPFLRIPLYLKKKKIDAATTINEHSGIKNIYYSNSHIIYQNVAISLKSKHLNINRIEDLKDLRVTSFQNGSKYLGVKYKNIIPKMKLYQELANQTLQVKLLYAKRVDVIILDINIFKYIRKNIQDKSINTAQKLNISQIFPKTKYSVGFLDKRVRDKFNIQLKKIKENGVYKSIFTKYIKNNFEE